MGYITIQTIRIFNIPNWIALIFNCITLRYYYSGIQLSFLFIILINLFNNYTFIEDINSQNECSLILISISQLYSAVAGSIYILSNMSKFIGFYKYIYLNIYNIYISIYFLYCCLFLNMAYIENSTINKKIYCYLFPKVSKKIVFQYGYHQVYEYLKSFPEKTNYSNYFHISFIKSNRVCIICNDESKKTFIKCTQCKHQICTECKKKTTKCPFCRKNYVIII